MTSTKVECVVNGSAREFHVAPRVTLADALREQLGLTGTHLGCEHGVCGACTVLFDGVAVRSCLVLAVQARGHEVVSIEGIAEGAEMHPVQEAFWAESSFQCGFCTPGFVTTVVAFLQENPDPSDEEIRSAISGNLCRCTGYQSIVDGVRSAAAALRSAEAETSGR